MRILKSVFVLAAAMLATATAGRAEPLKIRHSYVVPVANWTPLLTAKKDLAKHWGKSYVMEETRYQGTPTMITALATGELDIAVLAYSTLGLAIQNAGIDDLRVVADEFQDGAPGYYSNQYFVRTDSGINKIEDLKGKVLATNTIGSGIDVAMRAALKKHGLIDKRDYTVIEAPFPTMAAMLKEKKADLVSGVPPFSFNPVFKTDAKVSDGSDRGHRPLPIRVLDDAQALHRQKPCRIGGFLRGRDPHRALVSRPEEPCRGCQDRVRIPEGPAGAVRLAVYPAGLLPRSGRQA